VRLLVALGKPGDRTGGAVDPLRGLRALTRRAELPGSGGQKASEQLKKQLLAEAQCMRAHGVSGFPDPTFKPPSDPSGYSQFENLDGVILAIPNTINVGAPVFKQAAKICNFH
jgi:hypothetical protein